MPSTTSEILEELNLHKGTTMLLQQGIDILPINVRKHNNRLQLVDQLISTSPT